jgi:uncharacterized protein with ParB-like and HNH nuclease domain
METKELVKASGIEVASCTLLDLFNAHDQVIPASNISGDITIPEYQRPYVWKEKQINKLIKDLVDYKHDNQENKPLYYLGSIIIHSEDGQLKIIDGQQRITTMLILASFMNTAIIPDIEYDSPQSIANIKYNHSYLKAIFNKEIPEFKEISIEDMVDFSQINVTLILTESEDLAYTFFETQNTGGVRLSGTDIAKAHHLRAINSKRRVALQARNWERLAPEQMENCIKNLIKIRFWNVRKWNTFPFYKNSRKIKESIIEEFTERTIHDAQDISLYYSVVKKEKGKRYQMVESDYRRIRQPLYDGNNFMDYIIEYVELHQALFKNKEDHRISDSFYEFRDSLLHGRDGTIFLKELTEIALVSFVSRFGYAQLLEFSFWVYRHIYSMRVYFSRNVREDSIFKFVDDNFLIDTIVQSFTVEELISNLKKYTYTFNQDNTGKNQSKDKHVKSVKEYFDKYEITLFADFEKIVQNNEFDKALITGIQRRLKQTEQHDRY